MQTSVFVPYVVSQAERGARLISSPTPLPLLWAQPPSPLLPCGAREVRYPCAWRGGASPGSRVTPQLPCLSLSGRGEPTEPPT